MTALVEVHDAEEVARAVDAGAARHRRQRPQPARPSRSTGRRSPGSRPLIPTGIVKIAESGVRGPHDVLDYARGRRRRRARRREPGRPEATRGPPSPTWSPPGAHPALRDGPPVTRLPRASSRRPERPAGADPYFGRFGGRFVPEALDRGARRARRPRTTQAAADPALRRRARPAARAPTPAGRASLTEVAALRRARRRRAGPAQARGPQPHRLAQDQQRARPGAARPSAWARRASSPRPAPGSTASPRRPPRRCSAWSASSTWARRTPAARRSTSPACGCSAPRSSRSPPGRARSRTRSTRRCATGSTNVEHTHYLLGTVAGPHPFPTMVRDFQRGHRRRGARAGPRADRPAAGRRRGLRRRRLQRDRASSTPSSTTPRSSSSASRPAGDGVEHRAARGRDHRRGARRPARQPHLRPAGRRRPDARDATRSRPAWTTRASARSTPGSHDTGRAEYEPVTDAEAMEAFRLLCRTEGIIPAIESRARARRCPAGRAAELGPDGVDPGQPVRPRRQGRRHGGPLVRPRSTASPDAGRRRASGP